MFLIVPRATVLVACSHVSFSYEISSRFCGLIAHLVIYIRIRFSISTPSSAPLDTPNVRRFQIRHVEALKCEKWFILWMFSAKTVKGISPAKGSCFMLSRLWGAPPGGWSWDVWTSERGESRSPAVIQTRQKKLRAEDSYSHSFETIAADNSLCAFMFFGSMNGSVKCW